MISIWIRALLYLAIVGGGWLVLLPAAIFLAESGRPLPILRAHPAAIFLGAASFAAGFVLACWAGFCLIQYGRGTPLPLDPPRRLVLRGPYRWVRNPQAIAMVLMVIGEILALRSRFLWLLLPATFAYLEWIVGRWEERQLTRDFGDEYTSYATRVRKWLPVRPGTTTSR